MTAASGVDARLRLARLVVRVDVDGPDVARLAGELFAGGVDVVHLDRTGLDPGRELAALRAARASAHPHQALLSTGAVPALGDGFRPDVLQLGAADGPAAPVRQLVHPWARVGRSATDGDQLAQAAADPDVDHLWVGREPDLELVGLAVSRLPPAEPGSKLWFAVAGVEEQSVAGVLAAGARRVVVRWPLGSGEEPRVVSRRLRTRLNQTWREDPAMARAGLALGGSPRAPGHRG